MGAATIQAASTQRVDRFDIKVTFNNSHLDLKNLQENEVGYKLWDAIKSKLPSGQKSLKYVEGSIKFQVGDDQYKLSHKPLCLSRNECAQIIAFIDQPKIFKLIGSRERSNEEMNQNLMKNTVVDNYLAEEESEQVFVAP